MNDSVAIEKKDSSVDFESLSTLYCEVYAEPPWNQQFDQAEIRHWLEVLSENKTIHMEMSYDKDDKPMAFCIAKIDEPQNIINSYLETYKKIISIHTEGIPEIDSDDLSEHVKELSAILHNNEKIKNVSNLLYLMDVGIRPDLQRGRDGAREIFKMLGSLFDYSVRNGCSLGLAQTLSVGPMMSIISKRTDYEIICNYPDNSTVNHVTLMYKPDSSIFNSRSIKNE